MNIRLKTLTLKNFKGIKELSVNLAEQTFIYGANEAGKTTLSDAWHWLLTGKDSFDRKDFNIKNTVHTSLNRGDHEVAAEILVNSEPVTLKRVYREKWVKKRGEQVAEFSGNETLYFYNDVPLSQGEYQANIKRILPEESLKMLTNPGYFNTLPWKSRREVLFALGGELSDQDVASGNPEFESLLASIGNRTIADERKVIAAKKKKLNDELKAIPTRIDELTRSLPEEKDFCTVETEIAQYQKSVEHIDDQITDRSNAFNAKNKAAQDRQNEIYRLRNQLQNIEFRIKSERQKIDNDRLLKRNAIQQRIDNINIDIQSKTTLLNSRKSVQADLKLRTDNLRQLFTNTNAQEIRFDAHQFECPTCKRAFEADDIETKREELTKNFQEEKIRSLEAINNKGKQLVAETIECDEMIASLGKALKTLNEDLFIAKEELNVFDLSNVDDHLVDLSEILVNDSEYLALKGQIEALEAKKEDEVKLDIDDLKAQKSELIRAIDGLKSELALRDTIARTKKRISELQEEERTLAQQVADLERVEFLMDDFNRAKIDTIEARINGKFQHVTFKLFDRQINGVDVETCETMYKGVPYSDLNTAGKIWAGIDIINTLSNHYGVNAPIFLDNRESVTEIPSTASQIINLIVSATDKQLRVA